MFLIIFKTTEPKNLKELQQEIKSMFLEDFIINCEFLSENYHRHNEIAFLVSKDEVKVFYGIPRYDKFDIIINAQTKDIIAFLMEIFLGLGETTTINTYLSYEENTFPLKKIYNYIPMEYKTDVEENIELLSALTPKTTCLLQCQPHKDENLIISFETYDANFETISYSKKSPENKNFINCFFELLFYLTN